MKNGFCRKDQGIITVFVVMIMVPVVVITGLMVDIARAKLFAAQVAMSSDFYGEAILSDYDNVLKELYGLFSVTQNEEALEALETYKTYMTYSFDPGADGDINGSMFYKSADVEFSYELITTSSLSTEEVFLTQVADYMEFRVIPQVIDEFGGFDGGVFGMLDGFEKMESDNEAVSAVKKLGDNSNELTKAIKEFYDILDEIKQYEAYLNSLKSKAESYKNTLSEICKSSEYGDYVYYLENKEDIEELIEKSNRIASDEDSEEELTDSEEEIVEKYKDYNAGEYKDSIVEEMDDKSADARDWDSSPVDFNNIDDKIDKLRTSASKVERLMVELKANLADLRTKLENGCSAEVKEGIENDIADLEKLAEAEGKFNKVYENEYSKNAGKNASNKNNLENVLDRLDDIKDELAEGRRAQNDTGDITNAQVNFVWAKVEGEVDTEGLYAYLKSLFVERAESKEAEERQDAAKDREKQAVEELDKEKEEEEELVKNNKVRSIPDDVAVELKTPNADADSRSFTQFFDDGFDFKSLETSAARMFDKFLLAEYDFGMFSSRVSGKEKGEGSGETVDYSLNRVKMSPAVNYLYGAELEYLFGGNQKSEKNLAAARNTICGVRMTMNFISTYSIKELNATINSIANAAATATAATGVGAALAPVVRVAVSLALRTGIAAMETVKDWEYLKNRKDVLLYKQKIEDLNCLPDIEGLLGKSVSDGGSTGALDLSKEPKLEAGGGKKGLSLSYEDYLHVLLFLFVKPSDLVDRTSNLITLNVNQAQNDSDTLSAPLGFKMSDTATAVKTTCKARLDMVIVPQNFMDLFLRGDETQKAIEGFDDGYVYYTMIRGY